MQKLPINFLFWPLSHNIQHKNKGYKKPGGGRTPLNYKGDMF